MKLAKIVNNIVEKIIIGELVDFPGYINVTGLYIGEGWTDNGNGTYTDNTPQPTPLKMVGIGALGELLPSAVRNEVRAISVDTGQSQAKREAAARIITRLHSQEQIDASGTELEDLLSKLVTHTALIQPESDAILAALQV